MSHKFIILLLFYITKVSLDQKIRFNHALHGLQLWWPEII